MRGNLFLSCGGKRQIREFDFPLPGIERLEATLDSRRDGVRNEFAAFKKRWDAEYIAQIRLSAALVELEPAFFETTVRPLLAEDLRNLPDARSAQGAIWTLGEGMDRLTQELSHDNLIWALFLDIATTFLLFRFHDFLLTDLRPRAVSRGPEQTAEYYPGCGPLENDVVAHIADRAIAAGFPAKRTKYGMITPKKSQYSVLFQGPADGEGFYKKTPCGLCTGLKCAFYQMGSCHMGEGWLERRGG